MQKQSIKVLEAAAMASLVLWLTMVDPCYAIINKNQPAVLPRLILPSLDHSGTRSPGNGCNHSDNGGNHCITPVNGKAFARPHEGGSATNRKMMRQAIGASDQI
ncbi:unnamed protein product [Lactuca saligna]|uniref:Secreted protein n=1 Tax=Lactuca saligna TaxID=75948 RepID=A0AA35ZZT7_LACSI|nr:unnamed protein product [Lactuca saligna]